MSEYLTKEEIRKWRSSLERITLEEYAARLGKVIQEEKQDESLVDGVILRTLNSMTQDSYVPKIEKIQALAVKSFSKERELQSHTTVVKQEIPEHAPIAEIKPVLDVSNNDACTTIKQEAMEATETIEKVVEIENEAAIETETEQAEQQIYAVQQGIDEIETSNIVEQEQMEKITEHNAEQEVVIEKDEIMDSEQEENIGYSFNKALTTREQIVFDHFLENKNLIVYAKDLAKLLALPTDYIYKYIKNLRSKLNENILQNAVNGGYILKV